MPGSYTIRTNILSPLSPTAYELLPDQVITIENGKIASIIPARNTATPDGVLQNCNVDLKNCICIPGLIDTHVHLSQYRIKGHYRSALLPWLEEFVFPEEQKSASYEYAYTLSEVFFDALLRAGTTTAVIYTAPYRNACEAAFEVAGLQSYRAFIGMTMMDQNCPPAMQQNSIQTKEIITDLVAAYHRPENSLQYILTPRFAPTCSMEMMRWAGEFARANRLWIQTHLSENQSEIDWVKELFGYPTYTEVYAAAGLLTERTLLAHCIHLSEAEIKLIQDSGSKIAHCPDSNFYLKSGRLPLEHIRAAAIPYALGSDVGAGTSLNMLYHAKLYNYTQPVEQVSPADALYHLTLGAAKVLEIDTVTGSIQTGKAADLVFLRLPDPDKPLTEDILPELIFTGHEWEIAQVYLNGVRKV